MTGLVRFEAPDLAGWSATPLAESIDDAVVDGGPMYNGASHLVGTLRSPVLELDPFDEVVPSWTARTPSGTWIEMRLRVSFVKRWTRWYSLGVWAERADPVARHSVPGQHDEDAEVVTDTLRISVAAQTLQVEVALFTLSPGVVPILTSLSLATSTTNTPRTFRTERAAWGRILDVPQRSQMVHREGGGDAWCSPASVAMVLSYYGVDVAIPEAAAATYDWSYRGSGNWPFNTAYAARFGFDAYVARFRSLLEVERSIVDGTPIVASYAWDEGELEGAPLPKVDGHLGVIAGFDDRGDPVVNDPAAPADSVVRRTYTRWEFERQWLTRSRGTVYVIRARALKPPV
ncbi:MAG: peptidase C39 family protein [Chloroflexi bacterium]|nr:MAG: peptidase C39 family protein [Chloroflexota bacterium]